MDEPYIGTIVLFPFDFELIGWAVCKGQILSIQQYTALYSLLGIKFGGNGMINFALPNLEGKEPLANLRYYIALEGIYPPRG